MDQICRLCLTVSENMTCQIGEETMLFDKLSRLNIPILISASLPSLVCCDCTKTLDGILKYRENIIQNQYKLIEQLRNDTDLDDFYQNLKKDFSQDIKTEIDIENEEADQCFRYDPEEPLNKTKSYKINGKDKITEKTNNKFIYCEVVEAISCTKRTKTTQEVKKPIKFKKEKIEDKNNIPKNIATLNKKNQTTRIKEKLKRHKSRTKKNSTETIKVCKKFKNNSSEEKLSNPKLENYNETELKNKEKPFFNENEIDLKIKCLTCFTCLPSNSELIKHYKTIHHNADKENGRTDFVLNNTTDENKEIVTLDTSKRPFNCKICGRTFASVYAIVRHARAHSDYSLSCSHGCGYSTVYRGALLDHEKRHENDFRYKCATCGAGFHVKTWHDQHQNIHNNVKPFVCDLCGMAFHMDRYLTSHRSTVHAESLKGVKRFLCPHCDLDFDNARHFRTHLEEHIGKKKFLCALCGKECSSTEQLKYHHNSHLGLKPFACSICNKSFAKKFNLTVHQRAHAGEKHLCQQCGKHFAQRSTLLRHTRKCHPECKKESVSFIKK